VKSKVRRPGTAPRRLAVVALGSNLGDSAATIRAVIVELQGLSAGPLLRSSLWRSTPIDCPPGSPDFINAVVAFEPVTNETPESLLTKLHAIELQFGRKRTGIVNEARALDLDIIAFGDERRNTKELALPHPRATQRCFVLAPLAEILPTFQAPGWPATAAELLGELTDAGLVERIAP
jgi:2-amino-4-hydroxy-6-hydroxymethyldihydropteridine diphosphokinase